MSPQINNIISLLLKIFIVTGSVIYLIFAALVVKQVTSFSKNISDRFNSIIISATYIHLIGAGTLIFLALLLL